MTRAWLLLIPCAWMTALYVLSSLRPGSLAGPQIPHLDKVAHAVVYFVLVLSFQPWAGVRRTPGTWIPFAAGASFAFALADEFHQFHVPGRAPEWGDLAADAIGISLAVALCRAGWWQRLWTRRERWCVRN